MILRTKYETKKIEQTMHYKNEAVLEYKISYPVFESAVFFAPVLCVKIRKKGLISAQICCVINRQEICVSKCTKLG
jgi:hypothetical protein